MTREKERRARIVALLRERKYIRGETLSTMFGTSKRTIYRDMVDLQARHPQLRGVIGEGYYWREAA
jgi:DeoR/GlpR family transcriptional regulator of sugar metabolism